MISPRTARRAILVSWGLTLALLLGGLTLTVMNRSTMDINTASLYGVFAVAALSFSSVGGLIARRQASNPIGWLFCLMALALAALPFSQKYAIRGRFLSPGSLPAADFFGFASDWLFFVILVPIALVFLLFPEGRPLSPRWRIAVWAAGISGSVFLVTDILSRTGSTISPLASSAKRTVPSWRNDSINRHALLSSRTSRPELDRPEAYRYVQPPSLGASIWASFAAGSPRVASGPRTPRGRGRPTRDGSRRRVPALGWLPRGARCTTRLVPGPPGPRLRARPPHRRW